MRLAERVMGTTAEECGACTRCHQLGANVLHACPVVTACRSPPPADVGASGGSSAPVGAIVGGVVGGIGELQLLLLGAGAYCLAALLPSCTIPYLQLAAVWLASAFAGLVDRAAGKASSR